MTKGDYAKQLFESGMNCAQAVFCAFSDELGFDKDTALRISAGFGGGIGRLREVCGAVSGMTMTLSYKFACTDPNDRQRKAALYALIQRAAGEFKDSLPRAARPRRVERPRAGAEDGNLL